MIRWEEAERLNRAADAERISDWVKIDQLGDVWWRDEDWQVYDCGPVPLLTVKRDGPGWIAISDYYEIETPRFSKRELAIRKGLESIVRRWL